jgi:hypothetical protein
MKKKFRRKRMYAVSLDGVGLIAGTLAYNRQGAVRHFLEGSKTPWRSFKESGYRTVLAMVEVIDTTNGSKRRAALQ